MMIYRSEPLSGLPPSPHNRKDTDDVMSAIEELDPNYRARDAQLVHAESLLGEARAHRAAMRQSTRVLHEAITALVNATPAIDIARVIDEGLEGTGDDRDTS